MEVYDVIMKLVGNVEPVGETTEDNNRFENLRTLVDLTDRLLSNIAEIARANRDSHEHSVSRAGLYAYDFLTTIDYSERSAQ